MGLVDLNKFNVDIRPAAGNEVTDRKYTIFVNPNTRAISIIIDNKYDIKNIPVGSQVLFAEWAILDNTPVLYIYVPKVYAEQYFEKNNILLVLEALLRADSVFYDQNQYLLNFDVYMANFNNNGEVYQYLRIGKLKEFVADLEEIAANQIAALANDNRGNGSHLVNARRNDMKQERNESDGDYLTYFSRNRLIVTLLNPYIQNEVNNLFKKDNEYCINRIEILDLDETDENDLCNSTFNIVLGLRVGQNNPPFNNLIIQFKISPTSIVTTNVIHPR